MSDRVEPITALPLGKVLGEEFNPTEDQAWLAKWAERWMDLDSSAARGWHSNGTDLIGGALLWETTGDWLEIDVELRRGSRGIRRDSHAPDPVWTLNVVLMVACWCEDNHNAHYLEERRWDVGTVDALADKADAAYSIAKRWLAAGMDGDYWRQQAGLGTGPGSTILGG